MHAASFGRFLRCPVGSLWVVGWVGRGRGGGGGKGGGGGALGGGTLGMGALLWWRRLYFGGDRFAFGDGGLT